MGKKQRLFFLLFITIILAIIFSFFLISNKNFAKKYIFNNLPDQLKIIIKIAINKEFVSNFKNDYNIKFLPKTQFENVNLEKINLFFLKDENKSSNNYFNDNNLKSFYIEILNDHILWIINNKGEIFEIDINEIKKFKKINNFKKISTNLKSKYVLDTLINKNKIFFSIREEVINCQKFKIIFAEINNKELNFKEFFSSNECGKNIQAGRMQPFIYQKENGILFTTGDNDVDKPNLKPQETDSIYGKTIFKSFKNSKPIIYSLGHRNGQGLFVKNELVLMTEHGPRGGDEINKITFNKNYGWPIASYGEKYSSNSENNYDYKKSHENYDYEEPLFSFIPSIGISEIIFLPNSFSNKWVDNYLVTSLYGRSIFRIKFNENFDKIIYFEKIFIDERIRDIKFFNQHNMILLAFEEKGQLGILTKN